MFLMASWTSFFLDLSFEHRASMHADDLPTAPPFKTECCVAVMPLLLFALLLEEGRTDEGCNHRIALAIETEIADFVPIDLELVIVDLGDDLIFVFDLIVRAKRLKFISQRSFQEISVTPDCCVK